MHAHSAPASFYGSPAGGPEGASGGVPLPRLPPRGHGRRSPGLPRRRRRRGRADPARDADAERRRRAAPLRLEPLQLGLPRPGPLASHPARLPFVADPRGQRRGRSAPATGREGDRARRAPRKDRLHASAHGPLHAGRQHRREHARRCRRRRGRRLRGSRREDLRGQGSLGERRQPSAVQLRLLVPAAQERPRLVGVRRAECVRAGVRPRRRGCRAVWKPLALLEPRRADARADDRPRRGGSRAARSALAARSGGRRRVRRRGALEHDVAVPREPTGRTRRSR